MAVAGLAALKRLGELIGYAFELVNCALELINSLNKLIDPDDLGLVRVEVPRVTGPAGTSAALICHYLDSRSSFARDHWLQ